MKVKTTTARRRFVEQLIAPQLHTLYHRRSQKRLMLVGIPQFGRDGAYVRQCYAEAFLDFLEANNLLVIAKPSAEQLDEQGINIEVDLELGDLKPTEEIPPARTYRRMRPGETVDNSWYEPSDGPPPDLEEIAPALVTKQAPDGDPDALLDRDPRAKPTDAAREAFDRSSRRDRAARTIRTLLPPFLRKLQCAVMLIDDAETSPDHKATKMTLHIDLPTDTIGATK